MTTTISTFLADMPTSIKGFTSTDENGDYVIFINSRLSYELQYDAYAHELNHIQNNDHDKQDVEEIEMAAHDLTVTNPDPHLIWLGEYYMNLKKR